VIRPIGEKDIKIPWGKFKFGSFYTPMMILFTHGKKILGVKGCKPNFTLRDDAFFRTRQTTTEGEKNHKKGGWIVFLETSSFTF